jgi:hypothetical protein
LPALEIGHLPTIRARLCQPPFKNCSGLLSRKQLTSVGQAFSLPMEIGHLPRIRARLCQSPLKNCSGLLSRKQLTSVGQAFSLPLEIGHLPRIRARLCQSPLKNCSGLLSRKQLTSVGQASACRGRHLPASRLSRWLRLSASNGPRCDETFRRVDLLPGHDHNDRRLIFSPLTP